MKNVNEFTGAFSKEKLHLENVLGGGETRYSYQSLTEYHVLNFSICVPSNLTVALNCDGYDFVAYQSNGHSGYTNSPLMVAIVNQPLQGVQFDGVSSQLSFLNKIVNELQNQFKLLSVNETSINGYPALVINQEITVSGSHTSALFIANHTLTQLSISFNDSYSNAKELTQLILDSFTVSSSFNSTPQRGNSSQSVHLSWSHSSSNPSHSLNRVNQDSQWCDSNRGDRDSQYHDLNRGDQDFHHRDSNRGSQDSQYHDSNRRDRDSQYHDSNRGDQGFHHRDSNRGNQDAQYRDSNRGDQDFHHHDSNRGDQDFYHHDVNRGDRDAQYRDSNRGDQDAQYHDSNRGDQDFHHRDSNRGNQDSQYGDPSRGNQGSPWCDSNRGDRDAQYCDQSRGNQGSQCHDTNRGNQTSDCHCSNDSHQSQQVFNGGNQSHSVNDELNSHRVVSSWTEAVHDIVLISLPLSDFSHSVNE